MSLSVSQSSVDEWAATTVTVTASSNNYLTADQTVDLTVSGVAAGDYSLSGTTITIPKGSKNGSVTFEAADDTSCEGAETATLTLSNPSAGLTLGSTTTRTIGIVDDDCPPDVTFGLSGSPMAENAGMATLTAALTTPASRPSPPRSVSAVAPSARDGPYGLGRGHRRLTRRHQRLRHPDRRQRQHGRAG